MADHDAGVATVNWRRVADVLAEELARWGWGDFHYGASTGQEESVVKALDVYREAVGRDE